MRQVINVKKDEAITILRGAMPELREQFGVGRLWLFGSVARDEAASASDVDVLVEFDRPAGLFQLFRLQDQLESLLGCPVDLGTPGGLKPRIRRRVIQERVDVA